MRKKIALKSSMIGFCAQIASILLGIISTRVFIQELGIEIRGINGLLINCLGMLQLSDLGIGTAIIYALYQPLVDENKKEINILMQFYRKVYYVIGVLIFCTGIIMSFFIKTIIVDTTFAWGYILILFYMQLLCSVSTYFIGAYKRNLIYADQKQYLTTTVDMIVNILSTVFKIISLILWHSYIIYLFIQIIQTIVSNIIINVICNRHYPYLKEKVTEKYDKMPQLINNVKNIFIGRLGGFVYSSTDNMIISRFVGIIQVGYMSNYYEIINILKKLISGITQPIQPMLGNFIREYKDIHKSYDLFLTYTFIRYCIANVVTVSTIVMINPLLEIWLGKQFTLSLFIPVLMLIDVFIGIIHGPASEFILVLGLFENDRNMSLTGMAINLIFSIVLVIKLGTAGVLIGTVIAQLYYWIARTYIVFYKYFQRGFTKYLFRITEYISLTVADIILLLKIRDFLMPETNLIMFLILCCLCVSFEALSILIIFGRTEEFKGVISLIRGVLLSKK